MTSAIAGPRNRSQPLVLDGEAGVERGGSAVWSVETATEAWPSIPFVGDSLVQGFGGEGLGGLVQPKG